jgi:hypothetical protein
MQSKEAWRRMRKEIYLFIYLFIYVFYLFPGHAEGRGKVSAQPIVSHLQGTDMRLNFNR